MPSSPFAAAPNLVAHLRHFTAVSSSSSQPPQRGFPIRLPETRSLPCSLVLHLPSWVQEQECSSSVLPGLGRGAGSLLQTPMKASALRPVFSDSSSFSFLLTGSPASWPYVSIPQRPRLQGHGPPFSPQCGHHPQRSGLHMKAMTASSLILVTAAIYRVPAGWQVHSIHMLLGLLGCATFTGDTRWKEVKGREFRALLVSTLILISLFRPCSWSVSSMTACSFPFPATPSVAPAL